MSDGPIRQRPLRESLESPTDEARIARAWARIRARRERAPFPWRGVAAGGLALAGAAALLALALLPSARPGVPAPPGPLLAADGSALGVFVADAAPRTIALDDGSTLELAAGTRLEPLENRGDRFALLLARGEARFSVRPHGPRRWTIESGLASVEVVGTVFRVARGADGVEVEVERGAVVVRGERVPDRVARLGPGARLTVAADPAPADPAPELAARAVEAPAPLVDASPSRPARPEARLAKVRGSVHLATEDTAAPTLVSRPSDPRAESERLRRESLSSEGPRAAAAAFALGVLEMDRLHRPQHARLALVRALALGLAPSQAAEARARLDALDARPAAFEP